MTGIIHADVLELKNGKVLNGSYQGSTAGTLKFKANGQLKVIPVTDIIVLSFTGGGSTSATGSQTTTAVAATPKTTSNSGPKTIKAGTTLLVKTSEEIGTHNTKKGHIFTATLESKLMSGKVQVAPAGAKIYGVVLTSEKSGIGARKSVLEIT